MTSFQWDPHFVTNLTQVDEEHHRLVDLINAFGESLAAGELRKRDLGDLLLELNDYAHYHFENEERLMDERAIDSRHIDEHKEAHQAFFHDVRSMRPDDYSGNPEKAEILHKYLVHWLAYHILGVDQSMARQLRAIERGVSAAEAYNAEMRRDEGAVQPLLDAVNGLFSLVRQRSQALEQLNASLEQKVEERTAELLEMSNRLREMALNDQLTGLANRRQAMGLMRQLWDSPAHEDRNLCCIMIDADYFKEVNDRHGHDAGDNVLRTLAREFRHNFRTDDLVSRLGGDEFLVICPNTPLTDAIGLADRLHRQISALTVPAGAGSWRGSLSIGVAQRLPEMNHPRDLLKAADRAVYLAKHAGRNCVRTLDGSAGE